MEKDIFRAVQILALQSVDDPTFDDFYRSVCRWFSEKFSTPLPQVEEMAEHYVLKHYYETVYGEVKDATGDQAKENYEQLKASVLQTEVEQTIEESDDDQWAKELNEEVVKQTEKAMSQVMTDLDEHIKTIQQGGETFEGATYDQDDEY